MAVLSYGPGGNKPPTLARRTGGGQIGPPRRKKKDPGARKSQDMRTAMIADIVKAAVTRGHAVTPESIASLRKSFGGGDRGARRGYAESRDPEERMRQRTSLMTEAEKQRLMRQARTDAVMARSQAGHKRERARQANVRQISAKQHAVQQAGGQGFPGKITTDEGVIPGAALHGYGTPEQQQNLRQQMSEGRAQSRQAGRAIGEAGVQKANIRGAELYETGRAGTPDVAKVPLRQMTEGGMDQATAASQYGLTDQQAGEAAMWARRVQEARAQGQPSQQMIQQNQPLGPDAARAEVDASMRNFGYTQPLPPGATAAGPGQLMPWAGPTGIPYQDPTQPPPNPQLNQALLQQAQSGQQNVNLANQMFGPQVGPQTGLGMAGTAQQNLAAFAPPVAPAQAPPVAPQQFTIPRSAFGAPPPAPAAPPTPDLQGQQQRLQELYAERSRMLGPPARPTLPTAAPPGAPQPGLAVSPAGQGDGIFGPRELSPQEQALKEKMDLDRRRFDREGKIITETLPKPTTLTPEDSQRVDDAFGEIHKFGFAEFTGSIGMGESATSESRTAAINKMRSTIYSAALELGKSVANPRAAISRLRSLTKSAEFYTEAMGTTRFLIDNAIFQAERELGIQNPLPATR